MNNSGTPVGELSVSTRRGSPNLPDHPKELPQPHSSQEEVEGTPTPSHQGVDGAVARRPRSTS